eukprot:430450-Pyramimonas_sp.AAC.1
MKELGVTSSLLRMALSGTDVARRVTTNLDDNTIIQDIQVQDQPTGYKRIVPLPSGAANIGTR